MKPPLVSVIVTTKNNHDTLELCLHSIRHQTYSFVELIVVDNNSADDTKDIAHKYTDRVFNKGPERSAQRNFGVSQALGDYVLIIDSDMELEPAVVAACVAKTEALPLEEADPLAGDMLTNAGIKAVIIPEESFGKGFWAQCKRLERSFYVGQDSIEAPRFFDKGLYLQLGGYNEAMSGGEDWDFTRRIRKVAKVGRVGYLYRTQRRSPTLYSYHPQNVLLRSRGHHLLRQQSHRKRPHRPIWPDRTLQTLLLPSRQTLQKPHPRPRHANPKDFRIRRRRLWNVAGKKDTARSNKRRKESLVMSLVMKQILRKVTSKKGNHFNELPSEDKKLITIIRQAKLTYLSESKLASIAATCQDIESQKLAGMMIEAGCALGGSAILIAKLKKKTRPFYVYDVFGMIPPPTKEDGKDVHSRYKIISDGGAQGLGEDKYYGYEKNLGEIVRNNLKRFGVTEKEQNTKLIKGLLQKTMKINQPVAFAHIDVDWYDPVKTSLERIVPNLVIGGSIILDDYLDWSGCHKATNEFFRHNAGQFKMDDSAGSLKITRISD